MKIRRVIYKNAGKMCHFQIFICLYLAYNYNSDSRGPCGFSVPGECCLTLYIDFCELFWKEMLCNELGSR